METADRICSCGECYRLLSKDDGDDNVGIVSNRRNQLNTTYILNAYDNLIRNLLMKVRIVVLFMMLVPTKPLRSACPRYEYLSSLPSSKFVSL